MLEGRHFWHLRTDEGFTRSDAAFTRALAIDPDFAEAHCGLAEACIARALQSVAWVDEIASGVTTCLSGRLAGVCRQLQGRGHRCRRGTLSCSNQIDPNLPLMNLSTQVEQIEKRLQQEYCGKAPLEFRLYFLF